MTSHVPIHARNHRPGGVDPLTFPFPRARVWSTYATPVFTISDTHQEQYLFDHGITTHEATFKIGFIDPTATIKIMRGGVYGLTYRFAADDKSSATWEGTKLGVEIVNFSPDYVDQLYAELAYEGSHAVHSYITTIVNDPLFTPTEIRAVLRVPGALPTLPSYPELTFGDAGQPATLNTGCFIEIYRLGDTDTKDWSDWWYETPADVALPED